MAAQRHPCAGDAMYGADPTLSAKLGLERQWLHAKRLSLTHPGTGEWTTFDSEYPGDLARALDLLRGD
jgi:23S rRNA pseudouridine1911/1915/1917 synthase